MFNLKLSTAVVSCRFQANLGIVIRNKTQILKKMGTWKEEKEKYLSMNLDEKRKGYRCGNKYKTISDIPTWAEYAKSRSLAPKIPLLDKCDINGTLNTALVNKISVYRGDITTLEVCM